MRALVGERQPTSVDKLTVSAAAGVPTGLMMSLSQSRELPDPIRGEL